MSIRVHDLGARRSFVPFAVAAVMVLTAATPADRAGAGTHVRPSTIAATARWGYVWADQPSGGDYTPDLSYQRNSQGRVNLIQREEGIGDGFYRVQFPRLWSSANDGTVNITAYGSGGRTSCGYYSDIDGNPWFVQPGKTIAVEVLCIEPPFAHVDSQFDIAYSTRTEQKGRYAYVWADQPASPSYTPIADHQFNSKGLTNTITHSAIGRYAVHLPGLEGGTNGGTVKVTAERSHLCNVSSWGHNDVEVVVFVRCFDFDGEPANTTFTMTFANKINLLGSNKGYGYAWANKQSSPSYTPDPLFSASKPGGDITITRSGPGIYSVLFSGVGAEVLSHVQVTAYGTVPNQCRVQGWAPAGDGQDIGVECYDLDGHPADSRFTIQFMR
jgi:hypothetical protein